MHADSYVLLETPTFNIGFNIFSNKMNDLFNHFLADILFGFIFKTIDCHRINFTSQVWSCSSNNRVDFSCKT